MKIDNKNVPIDVFSGTIVEAEIVKSLLENAEIMTYLKDENTGTIAPWYTSYGGLGPVKVVVSSTDRSKAELIVSDFKKNIDTIS